jgi:hypothetical protein
LVVVVLVVVVVVVVVNDCIMPLKTGNRFCMSTNAASTKVLFLVTV